MPCVVWTTKSPGFRSAISAAKAASCDFVGLPRDQIGSFEQILRTENRQFRIGQYGAAPHSSLNQIGAGNRARMIGAFGSRRSRAGRRLQPELIRHCVFLKHIRQALELSRRSCEECDSIARLNQVACLGHRNGHVALKRKRGPSGNVNVPGFTVFLPESQPPVPES